MKTIIAGSRHIDDFNTLVEAVAAAKLFENIEPTTVLSGDANGVDKMGERWAAENGVACSLHPANWSKIGPMAGFQRNYSMVQAADALIALWDGHSKGTAHVIKLARQYSLPVYVHMVDEVANDAPPPPKPQVVKPVPKEKPRRKARVEVDLFAEVDLFKA